MTTKVNGSSSTLFKLESKGVLCHQGNRSGDDSSRYVVSLQTVLAGSNQWISLTSCFFAVTRVPLKAEWKAVFNDYFLLFLRVLNTTLFESWEIVGPYPSWWVFNLLLLVIQGLNCFWSYLIVKIACKAISKGKVR